MYFHPHEIVPMFRRCSLDPARFTVDADGVHPDQVFLRVQLKDSPLSFSIAPCVDGPGFVASYNAGRTLWQQTEVWPDAGGVSFDVLLMLLQRWLREEAAAYLRDRALAAAPLPSSVPANLAMVPPVD